MPQQHEEVAHCASQEPVTKGLHHTMLYSKLFQNKTLKCKTMI